MMAVLFLTAYYCLWHRARFDTPAHWMSHIETMFISATGIILTLLSCTYSMNRKGLTIEKPLSSLASIKTGAIAEMMRIFRIFS
jgi:hypothetical protein